MERLCFEITRDGFRVDDAVKAEGAEALRWRDEFRSKPYETLYSLAFLEKPACFDEAGAFLCRLAERFASELAKVPGIEISREKTDIEPSGEGMERLLNSVPFVFGSENVTESWIKKQFRKLRDVFRSRIKNYEGTVSLYFSENSQKLHVPERVFFHLVENKEPDHPFAFLATYATRMENGRVRHVPLKYALTEYGENRAKLLELLSCLNRAAEVSPIVGGFMANGELFHPLRLTADEAFALLKDIPVLEEAGILCRIPNWWRRRSSEVRLTVNIGEKKPDFLGLGSILQAVPSLLPLTACRSPRKR